MLDFYGEWHIIKVIKVEANESIGSPKRKDPLPELQSPKGGFFAPFGEPKPLPLGEVSPKVTERASPAGKSHRRSDGQALCQSDTIAVSGIRRQQPCPLSRACARQLPQRGSHWHVGQPSSGRAKHNISEAAVLRCLVQRQLDKERCPEAACPRKQGPPSCVLSSLRRPVESEPACQRLPLWGSCRAKRD